MIPIVWGTRRITPAKWPQEKPTRRIVKDRCPACAKVQPSHGWVCVICKGQGFVTPDQKEQWQRLNG